MSTIHNPSNFNPADYEVLDYVDNRRPEYFGGDVDSWKLAIEDWQADMARLFGPDWVRKIHHCAHCGNGMVRYITAVLHHPTGETVVFGADCTERLGFANKHAFKLALLKSRADAQAKGLKAYQAKQAFIAARPALIAALEDLRQNTDIHAKNHFAHNVASKLERYGSISQSQETALIQSIQRDHERAQRMALEASEPKGDAPVGRQTVTGKVLSIKEQESIYGFTLKMLVKLENNSKVWLTVPRGHDINRDDIITFKASFEQSRDDKSFGFGKRPHFVSKRETINA